MLSDPLGRSFVVARQVSETERHDEMTGYAMELLGTERLQALRHEAAGDRLVRQAAAKRQLARPLRATLVLAVARRFTHVGAAA